MSKKSLKINPDFINKQAMHFGLNPEQLKGINLTLSENDNMYSEGANFADEHYFNVGLQALSIIDITKRLTLKENYDSILDFGCGFGRVLRFLKAYYPDADITASELFPEYIDFCSETFNVNKLQSITDFKSLPRDKKYDLIWSGSVYTHIPADKFKDLFQYFEDSLNVGGVMVFTTHGRFCWENLSGHAYGLNRIGKRITQIMYKLTGYGYADYPHIPNYGASIMTLDWFARFMMKKQNLRLISIQEKFWDNHQDVIIVQKMK
jgi:SAM-dependent methyltransferase